MLRLILVLILKLQDFDFCIGLGFNVICDIYLRNYKAQTSPKSSF